MTLALSRHSDLNIRDVCWSLSLCAGQDVRVHSLVSFTVLARNVQALTEQLCGSYSGICLWALFKHLLANVLSYTDSQGPSHVHCHVDMHFLMHTHTLVFMCVHTK